MKRGRIVVLVLVVLAAFLIGLGLGAALDDEPQPALTTFDRTITISTR